MKVTNPDFYQYLIDCHAEQYVGFDDDMPESFDSWIEGFDEDDYIKYANRYAIKYATEIIRNLV